MILRVVTERVATLREVSESWTLCDLYDMNDALDFVRACEAEVAKPK